MLKIISLFTGILILGIGELIFARIVLDKKIEKSPVKVILIFLLSTLVYTVTNLYLQGISKTIIILIVHVLEFKTIFDIEYQKSILLTLEYIIIMMISEIVIFFPISELSEATKNFFYNNIAGTVIGNILTCVSFLLITILLRKSLTKISNYKVENNVKLIFFSIITTICILIIFYNAFKDVELNLDLVINIFIIIVFIGILVSLMRQTMQNESLKSQYEQILEFMTTYEEEIEKQRILRHETKNIFLAIKAQLTDNTNKKEIVSYINSVLEDDIKMRNEEYAKFKSFPANGLKGLCYYKAQTAVDKKINVSINISPRIKNSLISKLTVKEIKDLGKILGVFLDNAIEASYNSEKKKMGFEAYLINNNVKIIISNTYKGIIEKDKIGQEKYSTKGKNRGHGLLLVKEIVSNNSDMFETSTEITDELYIQSIVIKKH